MTAGVIGGGAADNNSRPTPVGSLNSNPQLALSQGYPSGDVAAGSKYATYLKLFSGEMIKSALRPAASRHNFSKTVQFSCISVVDFI